MPLVVGVSFKKAGKVYYFDPNGIELHEGNHVIAETARGIEYCEVMHEPKDVSDAEIVSPLKKIIRLATDADTARKESNALKEKQAMSICLQKIQLHNLPMKLIDAEYSFDSSQVTIFFSSESRVDFRELVKDLAGALKTKVQLHQVGVRDEAKFFGGIGTCGRSLCCASFLGNFEPVSMKMAKEQSLFLNPLKFSGICGKLMCCLKYEYSMYREVKSRMPEVGSIVVTPQGPGRLVEINVIKETMNIVLEAGGMGVYTIDDLIMSEGSKPCAQSCGQDGETCGGCRKPVEIEELKPEPVVEPVAEKAFPVPDVSAVDAKPAETPKTEQKDRRRFRPHRRKPNKKSDGGKQ
ncbi:MAG: PSP1 domain-containing protein [Armatimonadota bacterium]